MMLRRRRRAAASATRPPPLVVPPPPLRIDAAPEDSARAAASPDPSPRAAGNCAEPRASRYALEPDAGAVPTVTPSVVPHHAHACNTDQDQHRPSVPQNILANNQLRPRPIDVVRANERYVEFASRVATVASRKL